MKVAEKLEPYKGPQCHEDRWIEQRMTYNPNFRTATSISNANIQVASENINTNDQSNQGQPDNTITINLQKEKSNFPNCSFRVCGICRKLRVLDERARLKFPLGSYLYAGRRIYVNFTCDKLVNTTCLSDADIARFSSTENLPNEWLIVEEAKSPKFITSAILVSKIEQHDTISSSQTIQKITIEQHYHSKNHKFSRLQPSSEALLADCKRTGKIDLRLERRPGSSTTIKHLQAFTFLVPEPREPKCCQPWFDNIQDPDDLEETIGIETIVAI